MVRFKSGVLQPLSEALIQRVTLMLILSTIKRTAAHSTAEIVQIR